MTIFSNIQATKLNDTNKKRTIFMTYLYKIPWFSIFTVNLPVTHTKRKSLIELLRFTYRRTCRQLAISVCMLLKIKKNSVVNYFCTPI